METAKMDATGPDPSFNRKGMEAGEAPSPAGTGPRCSLTGQSHTSTHSLPCALGFLARTLWPRL